jgi:CubicO group peptidase (beta-lactamase class C family)
MLCSEGLENHTPTDSARNSGGKKLGIMERTGLRYFCAVATTLSACQSDGFGETPFGPIPHEPKCQLELRTSAEALVKEASLEGIIVLVGDGAGPQVGVTTGGFNAQSQVPVASASKLLVAIVLLSVAETHELQLDDPIGRYLDIEDPMKASITMRQLLSHTSGIEPRAVFAELGNDGVSASAVRILQQPLGFPPGSKFQYGGSSFQIAGAVAEAVTGKDWEELFLERVAAPLGLQATVFAHPGRADDAGTPHLGGGAWSTADDYSRVLTAIAARDQVLLKEHESWDLLYTNAISGIDTRIAPDVAGNEFGYSIGLWNQCLASGPDCQHWHSAGAFGTLPRIDPSSGTWTLAFTRGRLGDVFDAEMRMLDSAERCLRRDTGTQSDEP